MRRSLLAVALAVLVPGAATAATAADGQGTATYAEALAQARQQDRILIIDFYADW